MLRLTTLRCSASRIDGRVEELVEALLAQAEGLVGEGSREGRGALAQDGGGSHARQDAAPIFAIEPALDIARKAPGLRQDDIGDLRLADKVRAEFIARGDLDPRDPRGGNARENAGEPVALRARALAVDHDIPGRLTEAAHFGGAGVQREAGKPLDHLQRVGRRIGLEEIGLVDRLARRSAALGDERTRERQTQARHDDPSSFHAIPPFRPSPRSAHGGLVRWLAGREEDVTSFGVSP